MTLYDVLIGLTILSRYYCPDETIFFRDNQAVVFRSFLCEKEMTDLERQELKQHHWQLDEEHNWWVCECR